MLKQNLEDMNYKKSKSNEFGMNIYKNEEEGIINHFYIQKDYVELNQNDTNFKGGFETVQLSIIELKAILKTMEEMGK